MSPSGSHTVKVGIQNQLVRFEIFGTQENALGRSEAGSLYQRWYLCWDSMDRLWVHSSDLGDFVWAANANGDFTCNALVKESSLLVEMPDVFRHELPQSVRHALGMAE